MSNASTTWTSAPEPPPVSPKKLGLGAAHVERGRAARLALDQASPDAGAGETILHELVGHQMGIALAVLDAQSEVATRLGFFLDDPRKLLMLAKAMKELTALSNAIGRRVEGALVTASSLRAQRRLWQIGRS